MNWRLFGMLGLLALCLSAEPVLAQPDLRVPIVAGPLTLYPDDARAGLYYYPPGGLVLAQDSEQKPDLHLLQVRYTGTASTGDRGTALFRSVLSFRVVMDGPTLETLDAAKKALRTSQRRGTIELRPLPVARLATALVYTPIGTSSEPSSSQLLTGGHFEAEGEEGRASKSVYWSERIYSLGMDVATAQVLWDILQQDQVLLSLSYAFYASGIGPDEPIAELYGSPELVEAIQGQLARRDSDSGEERKEGMYLVRAGAASVRIDGNRWPSLLRRLDINEQIPPHYAALEVYCYDFNNALRDDLFLKRVEIEAEGVSGKKVLRAVLFERGQPELYVYSIRFPFAVRLDKPYRYRVVEIAYDGSQQEGDWQTVESWARILDVTSKPKEKTDDVPPSSEEGRRETH